MAFKDNMGGVMLNFISGTMKRFASRIRNSSGAVMALALFTASLSVAAFVSSTVYSVSTISSLQALGASSAQYRHVAVQGYYGFTPADGGGGDFVWVNGSLPCNASTAGGDRGTTFCAFNGPTSASGYITTGFWRRQTSGQMLNVLWFGVTPLTATPTQLVSGLAAALAACSQKGLYFPPGQYVFGANTGFNFNDVTCPVSGAGSSQTELLFQNATAGSTCVTINPSGSAAGPGSLSGLSIVGNASSVPTSSPCAIGLFISNVFDFQLSDVNVATVNGPCISIGSGVGDVFQRMIASQCNPSSTQGSVMFNGALGTNGCTTTSVSDISVTGGGTGAGYGIMVDNCVTMQFLGGATEGNSKLFCIGCVAGTGDGNIVIDGMDFEGPLTTGTCLLTVGSGLTGGNIVSSMTLRNNSFSDGNVSTPFGVCAQNTRELYATGNSFELSASGAVYFDFIGTSNLGMYLNGNTQVIPGGTLATVNGVTANAVLSVPWNFDSDFPTTITTGYPVFPACDAAHAGQTRSVTDSNTAYSSGNLGMTPSGGGTNKNGLKCTGSAWQIYAPF